MPNEWSSNVPSFGWDFILCGSITIFTPVYTVSTKPSWGNPCFFYELPIFVTQIPLVSVWHPFCLVWTSPLLWCVKSVNACLCWYQLYQAYKSIKSIFFPTSWTGVGKCHFLGILDITFQYWLEMKYPQVCWVMWKNRTFTNSCNSHKWTYFLICTYVHPYL